MDAFPIRWNIAVIPVLSILVNTEMLGNGTESEEHHIWNMCHSIVIPAFVLTILNTFIYKKLKVLTQDNNKQSLTIFAKAKLKAKMAIFISVIFIFASLFYCLPLLYWVSWIESIQNFQTLLLQ